MDMKTILEHAIKEEEYFFNFYRSMADKTQDEVIKSKLIKLSDQERIHKEKLETLSYVKLGANVIPDKFSDVQAIDWVMLTPVEKFNNLHDMYKFAIKQEVAARRTYELLAQAVSDEEARNLFLMLAEEERMHEQILRQGGI